MIESKPVRAHGEHRTHTATTRSATQWLGVLYPAFGLLLSPIFAGAVRPAQFATPASNTRSRNTLMPLSTI